MSQWETVSTIQRELLLCELPTREPGSPPLGTTPSLASGSTPNANPPPEDSPTPKIEPSRPAIAVRKCARCGRQLNEGDVACLGCGFRAPPAQPPASDPAQEPAKELTPSKGKVAGKSKGRPDGETVCSPEPAAQSQRVSTFCVLLDGKEQGPYTLQQIRSMWHAGRLTVETRYRETKTTEWKTLLSMLSEIEVSPKVPKGLPPTPRLEASNLQESSAIKTDAQLLPNVSVAEHVDKVRGKQTKYVLKLRFGEPSFGPLTEAEVIAECRSRIRVAADTLCARRTLLGLHTEWLLIREYPQFAPHVANMTIDQERKARQNAATNPPPTADCYLLRNGQQDGPFTPSQIRSMWKAGTISSDTLIYDEQLGDWRPVKSFCRNHDVISVSTQQVIGALLLTVGVIATVYFTIIYDTSVDGHIINLEKQQNRLIGIILGVATCAFGIITILLPQKAKED